MPKQWINRLVCLSNRAPTGIAWDTDLDSWTRDDGDSAREEVDWDPHGAFKPWMRRDRPLHSTSDSQCHVCTRVCDAMRFSHLAISPRYQAIEAKRPTLLATLRAKLGSKTGLIFPGLILLGEPRALERYRVLLSSARISDLSTRRMI